MREKSLLTLGLVLSVLPGFVYGLAEVEARSSTPVWSAQASSAALPNEQLEMNSKMEYLQQEIQELRGKLEEQSHQLSQLRDHQKKLYGDLDSRLQKGSKAETVSVVTQEPAAQAEPAPSVTAVPELELSYRADPTEEMLAAEETAYRGAYRLIQTKQYDKGLLAFRSLVKTFPEGKYVPNANYWLGEISLVKGELEAAEAYFTLVYQNYVHHPKAADSLLKLGYVEYAKGQWKRSQAFLNQVKSRYPGSTSAQLADSRLQRMEKEGKL